MSIRQPGRTTIYANDFRDKAYSFLVESVLDIDVIPGQLVVRVSAGYQLATSLTKQRKRKQTFVYNKQSDGKWKASGTITVFINRELPSSGTLVIHDSHSEPVTVTIMATQSAVEPVSIPTPIVAVSQPALTFKPVAPGTPSFLIITVAQQQTTEPVTLTTDAPESFLLATDRQPYFAPVLTIDPSDSDVHVHVRYLANQTGVHTGELLIQSTYYQKTIPLTGRSSRFLPTRNVGQQARKRTGLVAIAIFFGLMYVGYNNRFLVFPDLNAQSGQPLRKPATTVTKLDRVGGISAGEGQAALTPSALVKRAPKKSTPKLLANPYAAAPRKSHRRFGSHVLSKAESVNSPNRQPVMSAPLPNESELEQELNQKK